MSLIVNCKTYKNHCALAIFVLFLLITKEIENLLIKEMYVSVLE